MDVKIMVDAGEQQVDAVEVRIHYDVTKLEVVDADPSKPGVQLLKGPVFDQELRNTVDGTAGDIRFAGGRSSSIPAPTGTIHLATFKVNGLAAGNWPLTFTLAEASAGGDPLTTTSLDGAVEVIERQLAFTRQPIRGAHGKVFGSQPKIEVRGGDGLVQTSDNSTVVTLSLVSGTGADGAVLTCGVGLNLTVSAGVADFAGVPPVQGCALDRQGAGYVLEASAPGFPPVRTPAFNITLAGDADGVLAGGECRVSVVDFSLVVTHFGKNSASPGWADLPSPSYRADLNGDSKVGVVDFSLVVSNFGAASPICVPPSNGVPNP